MPVCAEYVENGVCTIPGCPDNHSLQLCRLCRVWCSDKRSYQQHLRGKKHAAVVERGGAPVADAASSCTICNVRLPGTHAAVNAHTASRRHQLALEVLRQQGDETAGEDAFTPDALCTICNVEIFERDRVKHERSYAHHKRERFATYRAAFDEAERDKAGVTVTLDSSSFFLDAPTTFGEAVTSHKTANVSFASSDTGVYLVGARMSSSFGRRPESYFVTADIDPPIRMRNDKSWDLYVEFDSKGSLGQFEDRLELAFEDVNLDKRFAIVRSISCIVGNRADHDAIKAIAPYVPRVRKATVAERDLDIEEGPKPPALAEVQWIVTLRHYHIPHLLEDVISCIRRSGDLVKRLRTDFLPSKLRTDSYGRFFQTLLHVEEAQLKIDIETFNMENKTLEPVQGGFYRLAVPGLAEKRPSLIVGDRILVQHSGSRSQHWWEGTVFRVRQLEVDLKFHPRFNAYRGQHFDIRFRLNRLVLRRMHQALDTTFSRGSILFPRVEDFDEADQPTSEELSAIRPGERKIADNEHQLEAIAAILQQQPGSPPFIVFGPPGTGKTITIVEAMRQLTLTRRDACILACAPSNSAADLLAERLVRAGLNTRELFRLNAPSRNVEQLPAVLMPYSRRNAEGTFCVPPPAELKAFRVIVSTCVSAGVPVGVGVPRGHFSHIFIDEAGQASEPEAMISIKMSANSRTNVVLAGDPKQLGPIVHSRAAQTLGLQLSLLDRLMARFAYRDDMRGISFVKLTQNFRSHPVILSFPNRQFYANELEPCGDRVMTHSLQRCSVLSRQFLPIVFENIAGKDGREAHSPSFFNIDEASRVKAYVQELLSDQKLRLTEEHIGVITPYHAQALKIRSLLQKVPKAQKIKVGSVEEFQGGERRVIIISTVRSSRDFVSYDLRHALGFVANPRRFNVAVTRAQALLIVVGDATVLSLDPLWRAFMNYIHEAGGWKGRRPDWDTEEEVMEVKPGYDRAKQSEGLSEMDAFVERTKEAVLNMSRATDDGELEWDGVVDKEWREAE